MKKLFIATSILLSTTFPSFASRISMGGTGGGSGGTATLPLPAGDTNYIQNTPTLQEPSTFYVDAGYVQNLLELNFLTQGSILFAGASGVISQDNSYLFYDATNHYFGLGLNSPTSLLHTVGIKPADNGSAQGTNAGVNILLRGAIGGDTTITTTGTGGVGGQIQIFGGVGGNAQSASTVSSGGVGGSINIQAGAGGVPNNAAGVENGGAGGGLVLSGGIGARPLGAGAVKNGGAGGAFTLNGGAGGIGNTGDGGAGGGFGMIGGAGGNTSISGTGGAGGSFTLLSGVGGNGVTGGDAGAYTLTGNRGGSGTTGNGGVGASMTFTAGNGGISTGGGNAGAAGDINFNAGDGNTGATNSNGGSIYFAPGVAVAPATTGYVYLGVDNTGAVQGHVVAGLLASPSSATFTSYASSADAASAVFVSTTGQTRNLTEWVFGSSTQVYVSSIGIVGVSTLTAVRQIRWADGTIQVSSPTAGTSGSFINNQETLQSGATFYVSSGTVYGKFFVNNTVAGSTAAVISSSITDSSSNNPAMQLILRNSAFESSTNADIGTKSGISFDMVDPASGINTWAQLYSSIQNENPGVEASLLSFWLRKSGALTQFMVFSGNGNILTLPITGTKISFKDTATANIFESGNNMVLEPDDSGSSANRDVIIGTGRFGVDYGLTFDGETSDGSIRFMEDEDRFDFDSASRFQSSVTVVSTFTTPSFTAYTSSVTALTMRINSITWGDGTVQVSSPPAAGGSGDNLGNHLATTTLSMQGFSLTNIGTSSSVFGTNGNLTVNSSATFVSTVTFNGVSTTTYSAGTALDMTAATFVLPTAASPPTNAVGQFGLDTTDSVIVGSTGTTTPLVFGDPMVQFTATISTDSTSIWQGRNVPIWQNKSNMDVAIDTITATTYSASASTLAFQLQSRPYNALNSNGTNIFTSTQPATWTGWTTTSFSSATIKANNYLVFFSTTTSPDTGTVNSIIVSVRGRKIVR